MRQKAGGEDDAAQAGLFGFGGCRRKARTTVRSLSERTPPAPDLVKRNFTPEAPDRLWVCGHHVRQNLGRMALPPIRPRHLLPADRRLVDGKQS